MLVGKLWTVKWMPLVTCMALMTSLSTALGWKPKYCAMTVKLCPFEGKFWKLMLHGSRWLITEITTLTLCLVLVEWPWVVAGIMIPLTWNQTNLILTQSSQDVKVSCQVWEQLKLSKWKLVSDHIAIPWGLKLNSSTAAVESLRLFTITDTVVMASQLRQARQSMRQDLCVMFGPATVVCNSLPSVPLWSETLSNICSTLFCNKILLSNQTLSRVSPSLKWSSRNFFC